MADPFEEFEFKPLTEGLGFHKKAEKIKSDIRSTDLGAERTSRSIPPMPPRSLLFGDDADTASEVANQTSAAREARTASQSISELMASLPPSLDFLDDKPDLTRGTPAASASAAQPSPMDRPEIYQPLGRKEEKPAANNQISNVLPKPGTRAGSGLSAISTAAAIPVPTMAPSPYRNKLNEGYARAFPQVEKSKAADGATEILVPVSANFAAGLIDAMVVAGISTIFLVCILTITKINLIGMLTNARTDSQTHFHLALLAIAVTQMYMLVSRAFFGASLGEWAFDLQMGTDRMQQRAIYPVLVLWRSLLTTATGLIVLPLLSFGIGRDLAKYLTGLQLYRRP